LTIYGDGSQTRSFCYVDDLVEGLVGLMASSDDVTGPVNLGNPEEFTMIELATTIKSLTGSRSELAFHNLPQDDPRQRQPDITVAALLLDWHPQVKVRDGLEKTIAFFREKYR